MQFFLLIFYVFVIPFALPTFKIYCKSITYPFNLPCIQFPQELHNTAFNIVFLPQMPHGSFLLAGFTVTCPNLLTITCPNLLTITRFYKIHFQAFILKCTFPNIIFLSSIKTISSAYNISCHVPTFISITSITMANNSGDKTDP